MWSFNTFKDKRYWILLIPAIIILVLFAVFNPDYILGNTYILPFSLLIYAALFWSTYHLWKYFGDKKKKNNTDDDCDL
ncbi:permease [Paenisporosarcina macmurdoensis]|uniref:Permease n=1 Tax=Paenisporosarcina macmurdoensis TaxID=212659 RepID=A0ABW1LBX1_9BACL